MNQKLRTKDEATNLFETIFEQWAKDASPTTEEFAALKVVAWRFFRSGRDMAFEEMRGALHQTANTLGDSQIGAGYY